MKINLLNGKAMQTTKGWGISACWWSQACKDSDTQDKIIDLLYGKDGLGQVIGSECITVDPGQQGGDFKVYWTPQLGDAIKNPTLAKAVVTGLEDVGEEQATTVATGTLKNGADIVTGLANGSVVLTGLGSGSDVVTGLGSGSDVVIGLGSGSDVVTGLGSGNDIITDATPSKSNFLTGLSGDAQQGVSYVSDVTVTFSLSENSGSGGIPVVTKVECVGNQLQVTTQYLVPVVTVTKKKLGFTTGQAVADLTLTKSGLLKGGLTKAGLETAGLETTTLAKKALETTTLKTETVAINTQPANVPKMPTQNPNNNNNNNNN